MTILMEKKITKIEIKRDLCIGAATCLAVAPDVYELDEENIAVVKDFEGIDFETLMLSAQSCPTNAIFLYDEKGEQVWPEL